MQKHRNVRKSEFTHRSPRDRSRSVCSTYIPFLGAFGAIFTVIGSHNATYSCLFNELVPGCGSADEEAVEEVSKTMLNFTPHGSVHTLSKTQQHDPHKSEKLPQKIEI